MTGKRKKNPLCVPEQDMSSYNAFYENCQYKNILSKNIFFMIFFSKAKSTEIIMHFCVKKMMTFTSSLDPDQAQHFVRPDLDSNCLTL